MSTVSGVTFTDRTRM